MQVRSGRLQFLAPHVLRSHLLRPGVIRLGLRLGLAQQMPRWARLQFLNQGVSPEDLDDVLSRITSLGSWVDEWEALGRRHEAAGKQGLSAGKVRAAASHYLSAAAAYNFAQYVLFIDIARKRAMHKLCVNAYAQAAPHFDPPARLVEIPSRRRRLLGYLRCPPGVRRPPVVALFNGTNCVKEELHGWSEALFGKGLATLVFDGPGMGQTWHRLAMVAEPRPVATAVLDYLTGCEDVDPNAIGFFGMSLGGYLAIRMAALDGRVKAVGALSPPFSADIYWNVTLAGMRRELAALYQTDERTMAACVKRITLAEVLPRLRCPLLVVGGGRDLITPGREAWRIFEHARCDRELIFYPHGAHDCFNMLADLRPRTADWMAWQLAEGAFLDRQPAPEAEGLGLAAEAVDPDFAEALRGEVRAAVRWSLRPELLARMLPPPSRWPWLANGHAAASAHPEMIHRRASAAS